MKIDELGLFVHCAEDSGVNIEDTFLGEEFSPLTKTLCQNWREKGYTEAEILLYAHLFENRQNIDWFNPKGCENKCFKENKQ